MVDTPDELPDLWPEYLSRPRVLSPVAILRYQATLLRQKTNNLLEGEVVDPQLPSANRMVGYHFEIVAPALNRYRYRVLGIKHAKDQVYPVDVYDDPSVLPADNPSADSVSRAYGQQEFSRLIQRILSDPALQSVIESLLAQSNEVSTERSLP